MAKKKRTIIPIHNPATAPNKKRLPKKGIKGGYYMKSTSKFHD